MVKKDLTEDEHRENLFSMRDALINAVLGIIAAAVAIWIAMGAVVVIISHSWAPFVLVVSAIMTVLLILIWQKPLNQIKKINDKLGIPETIKMLEEDSVKEKTG
jgi:membrane protein implicated in regulation of membrane protease activity